MKFKLFLSMLLAVSLLVACGGDDTDKEADKGTDTGTDVVSAASSAGDAEELKATSSENGSWIIIPTTDITLEEELVVAGTFHNQGDEANDVYRKFAAYETDADQNITAQRTITTPRLVVQSENLYFKGGIVEGDVYVEADGFVLDETATITGNLVFANADYEASADIAGTVEGETSVE
ncbi:hypothetical protein [Amphibacillus xylanus]|uniref:Lipoprotein n=1 Tax=Amphibacillus xylanus (strain ATCC 51415 / DSM 6626 / JCM 7361 / LMG 17667 / NBRC 15112 / Ep01) TaxID=698758 RepID=K0IUZ6_AMPXN|nr:hypothetical protein [Amphibacillus xylanus]BAM46199.1 hypothetical protein AXY_00670 [Amphibacillus xylanus NBRC 15112]